MRNTKTLAVLTVALTTLATCGGTAPSPDELRGPFVHTTMGELEGAWTDDIEDVSVFRGVPFAQPPVGDLRWRPPRAVKAWEGTRMATEFGPACWQARNADTSPYARGELPRSEDCLTLNV